MKIITPAYLSSLSADVYLTITDDWSNLFMLMMMGFVIRITIALS